MTEKIEMYDKLGEREISAYSEISGVYKKKVDVNEDAVYGGYDGVVDEYDHMAPGPQYTKYDFIDDGSEIVLIKFGVGSCLLTNGYELIFKNRKGDFYQITTNSIELPSKQCMYEQNLRWLKATDSEVVFINVEGESTAIACDIEAT